MLHKIEYLDVELIIAPRGSVVPTEDYIVVTSSTLRDFVDAQTITVEEDEIPEDTENENEENGNTTDGTNTNTQTE